MCQCYQKVHSKGKQHLSLEVGQVLVKEWQLHCLNWVLRLLLLAGTKSLYRFNNVPLLNGYTISKAMIYISVMPAVFLPAQTCKNKQKGIKSYSVWVCASCQALVFS